MSQVALTHYPLSRCRPHEAQLNGRVPYSMAACPTQLPQLLLSQGSRRRVKSWGVELVCASCHLPVPGKIFTHPCVISERLKYRQYIIIVNYPGCPPTFCSFPSGEPTCNFPIYRLMTVAFVDWLSSPGGKKGGQRNPQNRPPREAVIGQNSGVVA